MRRVGTNGLRLALCVLLSLVMVLSGIPTQALDAVTDASTETTENASGAGAGSDMGNAGGTTSDGSGEGTGASSNGATGTPGGQNDLSSGNANGGAGTSQGGGSTGSSNTNASEAGNGGTTSDAGSTTTEGQPLDLSGYIKGAQMWYVTNPGRNEQKVEITDGVTIPDSATTFELKVEYNNLPSRELLKSHGRAVTFALPEPLTNPQFTSAAVYDDSTPPKQVGEIKASNNVITITFNEDHLTGDNAQTSGSFTFRCSIDQSSRGTDTSLKIGDTTIPLTFQKHGVAESGELRVTKSQTPTYFPDDANPSSAGYLEYALTVATGADDMPNVRVEDSITTSGASQFVSGYLVAGTVGDAKGGTSEVGLTGSPLAAGTEVKLADENGHARGTVTINSNTGMTWNVGTVPANTTLSLTYRVKVNDSYVGLYNKTQLTNTATVYSETFNHGSASSNFTPHEGATVTKTASDPVDDTANNTMTIHYTVTIQPDDNNTWPIRNVKIADNLGRTYNNSSDGHASSTNDAALKALCEYAKFMNFTIKSGSETRAIPARQGANGKALDNPEVHYETSNTYDPRFDMYVGDVPTGTSLEVSYDLVVDKKLFTAVNGAWNIGNHVTVRTDDTKDTSIGGNTSVGEGFTRTTLGGQTWERKIAGTQLTEDTTQEIPQGDGITSAVNIAKGAVQYQVVVNEAGQWDVHKATLKDTLGANMQYVGYLEVRHYAQGITYQKDKDGATIVSQGKEADAAVLNELLAKTPDKTVYKDLSELVKTTGEGASATQSFETTLENLGLTDTTGAYVLTYYAVPTDAAKRTMATVKASNTFSLDGSVTTPGVNGKSGTAITMAAASTASISNRIKGESNFSASKSAWYFDYTQGTQGKAYWVITATGSNVPAGLALRDVPDGNNSNPHIEGVYVGKAGSDGNLATAYQDIAALRSGVGQSGSGLEALSGDDYTAADGAVTFKNDVTLGSDKELYIVVSSDRALSGDVNKLGTYTLKNKLQLKEANESEYNDVNTALLATVGGGNIAKSLGQVLTRDSSGTWKVVSNTGNGSGDVLTDKATEAGTYIDWRIKVNMASSLSGAVSVTDSLPAGVAPVYVRYFGAGSAATGSGAPTMPEVPRLDGSWKDIGVDASGNDGNVHAYYNSGTGQIRFDVGNLQRVSAFDSEAYGNAVSAQSNALEVQVLVRVTDENVLYGSPTTSAKFTNTVSAKANGASIGQDTSDVTVTGSSLSKTSTATDPLTGSTVPFTITVNPLGEKLGSSDKLTVVDELASTLGFNLPSMKVTDKDGRDVTSSVTVKDGGTTDDGGHRLLFEVPNGTPLTISYNTVLYVQPNQYFTYENKAYWFGHAGQGSTSTASVYNKVDATSTTTRDAQIVVTKRDAEDIARTLPGAEFTLQPVMWDASANGGQGDWTDAENSQPVTQVTNDSGVATFSNLRYNTVYRLTESKAPDGYVADSTARYVAIARNTSGASGASGDTSYLDQGAEFASHGATVQYTGYQYAVEVADAHATTNVKVTKKWNDGNNQDGIRPDHVDLTLTGKVGDKVVSEDTKTLTAANATDDNTWEDAWTDVPMIYDGQLISYSVSETPSDDIKDKITGTDGPGTYAYDVTGDVTSGFVVTNTHTPETTKVTVTKKWADNHNSDGIRPKSVSLTLTGKVGDKEVYSASQKLTADDARDDDTWTYTWTDLPAYHDGTKILYTLTESQDDVVTGVDGPETYKSEVSGEAIFGFTVTNTHTPETPKTPEKHEVPEEPGSPRTPDGKNGSRGGASKSTTPASTTPGSTPRASGSLAQTGDTPWPEAVGGLLLAALISAGIGISLRRRNGHA